MGKHALSDHGLGLPLAASVGGLVTGKVIRNVARSAPAKSQGDTDEEHARQFTRGCDNRGDLDRDCDGLPVW